MHKAGNSHFLVKFSGKVLVLVVALLMAQSVIAEDSGLPPNITQEDIEQAVAGVLEAARESKTPLTDGYQSFDYTSSGNLSSLLTFDILITEEHAKLQPTEVVSY